MTSTEAGASPAKGLRVAWFGHAVGRRADGLTSYSEEVVPGLVARGAEVWFHHAARDGAQAPVDAAHRVAWPTWRFKTVTVPAPGCRRRISAWLGAHRPQLVHLSLSFTLDDGWLGREARRRGAATVVTFHLPFGREGSGRALVMRQLHRFWASRLSAFERVIVFTADHKQRLSELGVAPERIEVLANAVDTERFHPGPSELRRGPLQAAQLVVGYAGRLDPEKGVRELLAGFAGASLGADARLLVAGQGALLQQVRRAQKDPRVIYLGQLTGARQRADFWRAVDVFCLPSSAEGLSIALLEAMASGCAVAATPAGGAGEIGEAVAQLDPGHLAEAIGQLLERLRGDPEELRQRRQMARREAVSHHDLTAMLTRLLAIYHQCLGERP